MKSKESLNVDLDDDDTFTFSPDKFINKKRKNESSQLFKFLIPLSKDNLKKKESHIIRIPLNEKKKKDILIDNEKINFISKKLKEIENELKNIFLENENEDEEIDLKNNEKDKKENKVIIPDIFNSEVKLIIQEKFDLLNLFITDITKILYSLNNYSKNEIEEFNFTEDSIKKIFEKIKKANELIENLNLNMEDYFNKISSLKKSYKEIESFYQTNKFPVSELNYMKIYLDNEYDKYHENFFFYEKIKKIIPYLCNKIIINIQNQKKLKQVNYKLTSYYTY